MPRRPPSSLVLLVPRLGCLLVLLAVAGCSGSGAVRAPAEVRTVSVAGRFVTTVGERAPVGVAGLRVRLLTRRGDGPWRAVPGPARRHRQTDVLDERGRFHFRLASAALADVDSLAIVPETATDAIRLVPVPRSALRLRREPDVFGLLDDAIRISIPTTGPVERVGLEAELRPEVGITVRYTTLAREFVFARYESAVPFDLPPVRVELSRRGGYVFQTIDPDALGGHEIELNAVRGITPTLVGHEYGHYVTYRMWGANAFRYSLRNRNLREGWAIFFSFAARAYAAAAYGDDHLASSNPEHAPFSHRSMWDRRYEGIVYGRSHPDYAAIGSLLWSLYDDAEASPFEPEALLGDNDDVSGHGLALFEAVRQSRASIADEAGIVEVARTFRDAVPATLAASVDGAFDHFLCPAFPDCDVKAVPDERPTTGALTLRPVAPGELLAERLPSGGVRLTWTRRAYTTPWANLPSAYHVLRNGARVATVGAEATAWTDDDAPAEATYEVRAVGIAGESANAPTARVSAPR